MYLVKHRLPGVDVRDARADADRRDAVRLRHRGRADHLGARDRRAADAPALLADPDRRLEVLPAPRAAHGDRARRPPRRRGHRVRLGAAPVRRVPGSRPPGLRDPRAASPARRRRDPPAGDLVGLPHRVALLLPEGVPRDREHPQRAARAGRRLARDALPGDARRRRHEAGADRVPVPRPGRLAHAAARVQRRHEHRDRRRERPARADRDRADGEDALVQAAAHETPAPKSSRRSAVRIGVSARHGACGCARVHLRGAGRRRGRRDRPRAVRALACARHRRLAARRGARRSRRDGRSSR